MKPAKALTITMVLCLTLVVTAQPPQQDQPQQDPQLIRIVSKQRMRDCCRLTIRPRRPAG